MQKSDIIIEIVYSHSQNVPNAEAIIQQKITNLINQELLLVPGQTRQRTIKLWEIQAMFFRFQEYFIISVMVTSQVSLATLMLRLNKMHQICVMSGKLHLVQVDMRKSCETSHSFFHDPDFEHANFPLFTELYAVLGKKNTLFSVLTYHTK